MNHWKALAALALAVPVLAQQYAGPAVLTRGQAPAAMAASQIDFRPFLDISGGYDTGLNGVGVDPNGTAFNQSAYSVQASGGISGLHSWRHTQLGLDYRAAIRHFPGHSFYDGSDQSLMLGLTHSITRHVTFALRTSAGLYTQNYNIQTLPQTVPFDPSTAYIPTNDFFDNRTLYISTQADLMVQKSTRLSYAIGADGFETRRRSSALYGVKGAGARGDIQYRLTRRSTVGVAYNYVHFAFAHIFSGTDIHALLASYAIRATKTLEFAATGGAMQYETKFIQSVPVDPAIAALIGLTSLRQISYTKDWIPSATGRVSYIMKRGVLFLNGGRSITPGNGLFLTSTSTTVGAGYTYTGLRKWSTNLAATYNRSTSLGNYIGDYGTYTISATLSRQVARYTHGLLSLNARKYSSPDFKNYNMWSYGVRIGFGFTPGDVPLRLW